MSEFMRLDAAMVARGLAGGRDKAKRWIADGVVTVNGQTVKKPSAVVTETDVVACAVSERFVGRGGEKLQKVLEETNLSVEGCVCADIGASTGGFTDCLLQHGAAKVYAIDVGHDQLAPSLREDVRVINMEGVDVRRRDVVAEYVADGEIAVCVMDVSFISITQIWASVEPLLAPNAATVCLIKPQFEAGRAALSKRGVVKSPKDHERVLQQMLRFWQDAGLVCTYLSWSPIKGGEGNIEYIAVVSETGRPCAVDVTALVSEAFAALA